MKHVKIFIDSNILGRIEELESLPIKLFYYYPLVDQYHIKENHLKEDPLPSRTFLYYPKAEQALKEAAQIVGDKSRFHLIKRFNQTEPMQAFSSSGPISYGTGVKLSIDKEKINLTLNKIRKILPNISQKDKDLYVLLTIILCNDKKDWVAEYDWIDGSKYYDFSKKVSLLNSDGKKYFLTLDKTGIYTQNNIRTIEREFPNLKIFNINEFKKFVTSLGTDA